MWPSPDSFQYLPYTSCPQKNCVNIISNYTFPTALPLHTFTHTPIQIMQTNTHLHPVGNV